MDNEIIADKEKFELLKQRIKGGGSEKLHVLADFDKTLTRAFFNGKRQETVVAQIRVHADPYPHLYLISR